MGYINYSYSEGAADARANGEFPATDLARELKKRFRGRHPLIPKITARDIRQALTPSAWHHTSARYNETDFFSARLDADDWRELFSAIRERLAEPEPVWKPCSSAVIKMWGGSRRHPTCVEQTISPVAYLRVGDWYTFKFADGMTLRKKWTTVVSVEEVIANV